MKASYESVDSPFTSKVQFNLNATAKSRLQEEKSLLTSLLETCEELWVIVSTVLSESTMSLGARHLLLKVVVSFMTFSNFCFQHHPSQEKSEAGTDA